MKTMHPDAITVETTVKAPIDKVWDCFNNPEHITRWNRTSDDWHAPHAENDLRKDGKFKTTLAAKDGSSKFDLVGTYSKVEPHKEIEYAMSDGRKVHVDFIPEKDGIRVKEIFEPETQNPREKQKGGWQSTLNNFKKYTESVH